MPTGLHARIEAAAWLGDATSDAGASCLRADSGVSTAGRPGDRLPRKPAQDRDYDFKPTRRASGSAAASVAIGVRSTAKRQRILGTIIGTSRR